MAARNIKFVRLYQSDKGIWRYDMERDGKVYWSSLDTRDEQIARSAYDKLKAAAEQQDGDRLMPAPNNHPPQQTVNTAIATALGMLNASMTAEIALMLTIPVPASDVLNLFCEHIGKLLALIEPEQLRNSILGEIWRNLPAVVNRHVTARMTTPGGVLLPGPERMQ